ncbi:MAG: hypothetical protein KAH84_03360 [Thiomargarita sp.]|nr:hypothetical protein [Thiomargarita sp.]
MNRKQRSLTAVPKKIIVTLVLILTLQITWNHYLPSFPAKIEHLTTPPQLELLQILSLGDNIVGSKLLMLWLQAFDSQSGQFLSYRQFDYDTLRIWLKRILQLDPKSQYPLLAASHFYSMVNDTTKKKQMLNFVYKQFFIDPDNRWQWLAHASLIAKHRLKDLPLALKYAQAIAAHSSENMPFWAKEMQIFILEDMGELEQVRLIVGGMFANGQITELNEIKYFNEKLENLENLEKQLGRVIK